MSDTFTLTAVLEAPDQSEVDRIVEALEARQIEMEAPTIPEPDTSDVDSKVSDIEGESIDMEKPVIPAPDTQPVKDKLTDLDTKTDNSRNVMANLTGNVAGDLANVGGAAGSTGVAIGQLAEYAADGNISLGGLAKMAGPMLLLTAAVEIGTRAWQAYTAKTKETERTTKAVSEALAEQGTALDAVTTQIDDLIDSDAASAFDKLNKALMEGLDEGEVIKVVGALGELGLTVDDLAPTMAALEDDTDDARGAMEALGEQAGIHPGYVDNIAKAVHAGEDMAGITDALVSSLMQQGLSFVDATAKADELVDVYGDEIKAMEQLNDAQQNTDFDKIAEDQLKLARGADMASAAMIAQAEAELGPDASALDVWARYIELQNEATAAAEEQAAAAEIAADAAEGAIAFADAISSVDWQEAELAGAATAMSAYSEELFRAGNLVQDQQDAYGKLATALTDTTLQFDQATEAGFAQQDAIEELTGVVDQQLAVAYDKAGGSFEQFALGAKTAAADVRGTLMNDLGLTVDQANSVLDAMGLLDDKDIEARFNLAGAEEARLKLGLLSSAITGLPPDVERQVTLAVTAGDYTTALAMIETYYQSQHPEVIAEVTADGEPFINEVDEIIDDAEGTTTTMPVDADTGEASEDIAAVEDADHSTTIDADADTQAAARQLLDETTRQRSATIYAIADATAADTRLDTVASQSRTATITADALTANAESELNNTARTRTSYVNQVVRSISGGTSPGTTTQAAGLYAVPMAAPAAAPVAVTINTAVIGDPYAVQRTVTRAVRGAVRLSGARHARSGAAAA